MRKSKPREFNFKTVAKCIISRDIIRISMFVLHVFSLYFIVGILHVFFSVLAYAGPGGSSDVVFIMPINVKNDNNCWHFACNIYEHNNGQLINHDWVKISIECFSMYMYDTHGYND